MKEKSKLIAIFGWFGFGNLGDEAILSVMVSNIKSSCPGIRILVFSNEPQKIAEWHKVQGIEWSRRERILWKHVIRSICACDVFVIGGGGLLNDYYNFSIFSWAVLYMGFGIVAKLLGKKVMLYGIGVGPIRRRLERILTRIIANRIDLICARDKASRKLLEELGVNKSLIYLTADPAVLLPSVKSKRVSKILTLEGIKERNRPLVGVCIRYPPPGKEHKFNELKRIVAETADYMITKGTKVIFFPFHSSGGGMKVAREIFANMHYKENAHIISGYYMPAEIKGLIGEMDMVIGMRLHACIFAATTYVPLVSIAYDQKVHEFLKEIGQEKQMVSIDDITSAGLIEKLDYVWENRTRIKAELKEKIEPLKERALLNHKLLLDLLHNKRNYHGVKD